MDKRSWSRVHRGTELLLNLQWRAHPSEQPAPEARGCLLKAALLGLGFYQGLTVSHLGPKAPQKALHLRMDAKSLLVRDEAWSLLFHHLTCIPPRDLVTQ